MTSNWCPKTCLRRFGTTWYHNQNMANGEFHFEFMLAIPLDLTQITLNNSSNFGTLDRKLLVFFHNGILIVARYSLTYCPLKNPRWSWYHRLHYWKYGIWNWIWNGTTRERWWYHYHVTEILQIPLCERKLKLLEHKFTDWAFKAI